MKVGIMQPYFFPYIGYWQLINYVDEFVIFDTPQFIRHGWIERNRILNHKGEPIYFRVPLIKHKRETSIKDIQINNTTDWQKKILSQLQSYKKNAPNYWSVMKILEDVFSSQFDSIVTLNYEIIKRINAILGITTKIYIFSEMNINKNYAISSPDEWALNISKEMNVKEYINPINGISFFNRDKYLENGLTLSFLKPHDIIYKQKNFDFQPSLSIIDLLMYCDVEVVKTMLNEFDLI